MDHTDHQWYRQMQRALQLSGKSPNTQESYLRSVRQLADHLREGPARDLGAGALRLHPLSPQRQPVEAGDAAAVLRRAGNASRQNGRRHHAIPCLDPYPSPQLLRRTCWKPG